jgi:hypothetical protein
MAGLQLNAQTPTNRKRTDTTHQVTPNNKNNIPRNNNSNSNTDHSKNTRSYQQRDTLKRDSVKRDTRPKN